MSIDKVRRGVTLLFRLFIFCGAKRSTYFFLNIFFYFYCYHCYFITKKVVPLEGCACLYMIGRKICRARVKIRQGLSKPCRKIQPVIYKPLKMILAKHCSLYKPIDKDPILFFLFFKIKKKLHSFTVKCPSIVF